jgi:hypothetical protein
MTFAGIPSKQRIAIIGDSFTFGLEVRYEDTWGYQLERLLGPGAQVLNFGVDGYGVDQAYLRYLRDVRSWHPDFVIFGIINDDLARTMGVYGFLKFLQWEMPFPKPRFVVKDNSLRLLNVPLPTPDSIFAKDSIRDLPFIEHDGFFQPHDWEWHPYHYSYAIRYLLSRFPRWPVTRSEISDEAMRSINGKLFRTFVQSTQTEGSTPIVVYFPSRSHFRSVPGNQLDFSTVAQEVLKANQIPYIDMTGCVSAVSPIERFVIAHYSPISNAAIATCLANLIRPGLENKRE